MVRALRAVPASARRTPSGAEGGARVTVDDSDPSRPVVTVDGDIDAPAAAAVGERIARACASDAHLLVDTTGVGYLDSSGVRLLAELSARHAAAGGGLTVRAPAGGPVHRILALTGLDAALDVRVDAG
jgi:anti-anti-sigma factor